MNLWLETCHQGECAMSFECRGEGEGGLPPRPPVQTVHSNQRVQVIEIWQRQSCNLMMLSEAGERRKCMLNQLIMSKAWNYCTTCLSTYFRLHYTYWSVSPQYNAKSLPNTCMTASLLAPHTPGCRPIDSTHTSTCLLAYCLNTLLTASLSLSAYCLSKPLAAGLLSQWTPDCQPIAFMNPWLPTYCLYKPLTAGLFPQDIIVVYCMDLVLDTFTYPPFEVIFLW